MEDGHEMLRLGGVRIRGRVVSQLVRIQLINKDITNLSKASTGGSTIEDTNSLDLP